MSEIGRWEIENFMQYAAEIFGAGYLTEAELKAVGAMGILAKAKFNAADKIKKEAEEAAKLAEEEGQSKLTPED